MELMNPLVVLAVAAALLLVLAIVTQLGYLGAVKLASAEPDSPSLGAIDGSVFALLGLLLAFSFSASAGRFQARREIVVNEANAIGTAQLRLDLVPPAERTAIQAEFASYVQNRLQYGKALSGEGSVLAAYRETQELQNRIWKLAAEGVNLDAPTPRAMLLLPALNDMFDAASARHVATQAHAPVVIMALLVGLSILSAYMAGRTVARIRASFWQRSIYALVLTVTLLVIADLDYPRLGLIRLDYSDELMVGLQSPVP